MRGGQSNWACGNKGACEDGGGDLATSCCNVSELKGGVNDGEQHSFSLSIKITRKMRVERHRG